MSDFHFPAEPGEFRSKPSEQDEGRSPFSDEVVEATPVDDSPYASGAADSRPYQPTDYEQTYPHRGGLVLFFGLLGLLFTGVFLIGCPLLAFLSLPASLPAMILGGGDLRAMKHGAMDRRGYGMTMAGFVIATASIVLAVLVSALVILWAYR